jgi:hypothetical protein
MEDVPAFVYVYPLSVRYKDVYITLYCLIYNRVTLHSSKYH